MSGTPPIETPPGLAASIRDGGFALGLRTRLRPLERKLNPRHFGRPYVDPTARVARGVVIGPTVRIGRLSHVNGPATIIARGDIGSFASIGWQVTIGAFQHPHQGASHHAFWYTPGWIHGATPASWHEDRPDPVLGHDVYVGAGSLIMQGITIGDGVVVGSGSVVTRDIPAYAIVVGVPARVHSYRFDEATREALSATEWWTWPDTELREILALFESPRRIIDYARSR
jgi:acetyltransferase-like isoleucine patch superfamily enzyme